MGFYWNSFLIHSCHVGIDTELVKSACSWRQSGEEGDNPPQLFHLSILWLKQELGPGVHLTSLWYISPILSLSVHLS